MKYVKFIFLVFFLLIPISKIIAEGEDMVIKPMLPSNFSTICTLQGKVLKDNQYRYKGRENDILFLIDTFEKKALPESIVIRLEPFNGKIEEQLLSTDGVSVIEIVGYESFRAEGIPTGIEEYVFIPSVESWSVHKFFVVVHAKTAKANEDENKK